MKLRNIVASFLAVAAMTVSCVDELSGSLSLIKLDQSTIMLPEQGGSATIMVTAETDWSVDTTTVPAEVTVSPLSGTSGETKMTISTEGGSADDIAANIVIKAGHQKQFIKFYQPGDPSLKPQYEEFTAGDYWIMAKEEDKWFVLKSTGVGIDDDSYSYIYSEPAIVGEDGSLSSTAATVYTFEAVEGGFIIKDPNGGYLYQVAKYDNFYLTADKAKASVWTVEQISDDEFMIEISESSKWMQYSTSYDSAGAYGSAKEDRVLPKLVKAEAPSVDPFVIEETEFSLPIEAGEFVVNMTCLNEGFEIVPSADWVALKGMTSEAGEYVITFAYSANEGPARAATIDFVSGEETITVAVDQEGSIMDMTVADFLAAEEGVALYKLTGKVANLQTGDYGNFDLVDATGSVYVYGLTATPVEKNDKSFPTLGIKEGDIVTLIGTRTSYNGAPQVGGPAYYVSHEGHTEATVAEFLAAAEDDTWYMLSGTISDIVMDKEDPTIQSPYGNFNITDETGTVYVYGLTVAPVAKNDKSFPSLDLKEGDVVTLIGKRTSYGGVPQVGGPAYYISHEAGAAVEYSLDGKQWIAEMDGMQVLFDFGLAEEGMLAIALPTMDGTGFGLHMAGIYEIQKTDAVSGVVSGLWYDWENEETYDELEIPYSELGEASVKLVCETVFGISDPVAFTAVENPYEIQVEGSGDGPEGAIPNGDYWFTNGGKVMAPMAEGATSGVMPANDLINGASTAKNIFTLTYDPDMSYYTIQDSYGRYLGNESWGNDISLTTVLPSGEDYAYYLWSVDTGFDDGTFDIYNAASYNGFAYSAADNNWYLDPVAYETDGIRPTLVLAENPVDEPVEPEVPSFEAGQYFVMDGKGKVVSPIAESATYGYWNVQAAVEDAGSYIGYAENVFTIAAVDGGYTIQDVYGRYHYMTTYNSFSVSKSTQSDNSHVWTITLQDDGTYAIVNTVSGKTVQFSSYGNYAPYTDVTGALPYLVKADKIAEKPEVPDTEAAKYATTVTCKTVSSAYTDGVANVNGVPDVYTLKLGTSKLNGKATITLPAGTTEVTYYAVGWKGTSAQLQFSVAGSVVGTQSLAANTGATGSSPYTMTVSDSDHYTFSLGSVLEADTEVTVETTGSAYRAIIFGIQAK